MHAVETRRSGQETPPLACSTIAHSCIDQTLSELKPNPTAARSSNMTDAETSAPETLSAPEQGSAVSDLQQSAAEGLERLKLLFTLGGGDEAQVTGRAALQLRQQVPAM